MTELHGEILVVDDNRMNRITLSSNLELQGHTVFLAEDGETSLAMMRKQSYDVVLLDIMMPGKDGYEVLQEMKRDAELRDIPVIVVSALDEIDSAVRCIELGAEDYLPKPFDPVLLRARLRATLEKKRLRDLERAYLQQEVMLRQNEKLATLGKLSAGMAHELNNPVAAVLRGTEHLATATSKHLEGHFALDRSGLTVDQTKLLEEIKRAVQEQAHEPDELDALTRADREAELEKWLVHAGLDAPWELAPGLVALGFDSERLSTLAAGFHAEQLIHVLTWTVNLFAFYSILEEMREGSGRVADIVKALKAFTYLDQAPVQNVSIHAGLDNTLIMLRSRLKRGVDVQRHYAADLPQIEARGSELNQVWTNIIDNAVQAMGGQGELILRTFWEAPWVVVEIQDNGPGIPASIQGQLFDPFFTTKPPGEGTGLGLNISHNIIVQKHGGMIAVDSQPGRTCFQIRLPVHLPEQLQEEPEPG